MQQVSIRRAMGGRRGIAFGVTVGLAFVLPVGAIWGATRAAARDQLRALLGLPRVSFQLGLEFNHRHGWVFAGDALRAQAELDRLRDEPGSPPGTPLQMLRFAELNDLAGNAAASRQAIQRAIGLFEETNAADAEDDVLVAGYARALRLAGRSGESLSLLRRVQAANPEGWRSRLEMGLALVSAAAGAVFPSGEIPLPAQPAEGGGAPPAVAPSAAQVESMRGLLDQAEAEAEQAVQAGVSEAEARLGRARIRTARRVLEALLGEPGGDEKVRRVSRAMFSAESLPDLATAARLAPDDPRVNAIWVWSVLLAETVARGGPAAGGLPAGVDWGSLPEDLRQVVRQVLARMDRAAQSEDPHLSSQALELAGSLQFMVIGDPGRAETGLREAVTRDPTNQPAWEVLCASLATAERFESLMEVARKRLKTADNARNRFILAKAYDRLERRGEARMELQQAWAKWPKDPLPALGLCALVVRDDLESAGLGVAARLLGAVQENLGKNPSREMVQSLLLVRGVVLALAGRLDPARQSIEQLLSLDPEDVTAREALRLLDRLASETG
ncbi:MAG: hypothetical protein H7A45_11435 [Verrucomicrobiales bacterium]|nr:hypothetical protein [Verrucomicrobiales bacterium]MCP5526022.1 hypothetical protein [Verrucomicrobiales bacterium]